MCGPLIFTRKLHYKIGTNRVSTNFLVLCWVFPCSAPRLLADSDTSRYVPNYATPISRFKVHYSPFRLRGALTSMNNYGWAADALSRPPRIRSHFKTSTECSGPPGAVGVEKRQNYSKDQLELEMAVRFNAAAHLLGRCSQ